MKKVLAKKEDRKDLMKNLEFEKLVNDSEKLAKVNDLWYFVKSKGNRWVVGSGH
ncbi:MULTISPECIES: epipeptide YydF family RiPP [Staphylococcus]|uniref:YydF family exported signaling peptide n=1 Tax=Staphylococcus pettenkoferi TaxID=170573 RepID=A0A2N6QHP6_9STAP|nr:MULTISPECIES: epipeptide YydF family RiPP [Staphylococcus]MCI2791609.1 epipeptide YydF family RiPP [Staphylococcus pettenkoferi]MCY1604469.1 epipeptide YydF family RiPP [Staphylococcus pettenkoferi]OFK76580.1 sugar tyrosine-protein kinase [Staphylococcus sp. HMSC071G07]PMC19108.1 YydF family exported signaling peptide [Staphylococcus pettenkoferi]